MFAHYLLLLRRNRIILFYRRMHENTKILDNWKRHTKRTDNDDVLNRRKLDFFSIKANDKDKNAFDLKRRERMRNWKWKLQSRQECDTKLNEYEPDFVQSHPVDRSLIDTRAATVNCWLQMMQTDSCELLFGHILMIWNGNRRKTKLKINENFRFENPLIRIEKSFRFHLQFTLQWQWQFVDSLLLLCCFWFA